jgi:hypothetical protein
MSERGARGRVTLATMVDAGWMSVNVDDRG